jgi:RNase adapter protein RapZ
VSPRRVVLVSGLSGAGRASILRTLEDLGYEAVDNPPLTLTEELVTRAEAPLAIGLDARSRGFDAAAVLATLERLRLNPALQPELVFAWADEPALLRRFTETRRRHPLAPDGRVVDGIAREVTLTTKLRESADLVLDTSDTPLPVLRRLVEERFAFAAPGTPCLTVSLTSFAYPRGLPREADLVFDARFLRNPHYVLTMRRRTGLDADVAAYVEADPDFPAFFGQIEAMLSLLLPRFVQEGKRYVTIAIGCTGGRHRSVRIVEKLAERLGRACTEAGPQGAALDRRGWQVTVMHRELSREGINGPTDTPQAAPFQAQEA